MHYRYMHLFVYVHILCTQVLFAESEFEIRLFKVISQLSVQVVLQSSLWMNHRYSFSIHENCPASNLEYTVTADDSRQVKTLSSGFVWISRTCQYPDIFLKQSYPGPVICQSKRSISGQLLETVRTTRENKLQSQVQKYTGTIQSKLKIKQV